jgi:uncharacterized protein YkwD
MHLNRYCSFCGFVLFLCTWLFRTEQSACAQSEYAGDGTPTANEEAIRWRVNRGRFDSVAENQARGTSYADIPASSGPLAPNQSLTLAARHHSEDMATHNVFQHETVPGSTYYDVTTQPQPWDRMKAEGYTFNSAAENIAAGYSGAEAAYVGWWNSTGHRKNMFNSTLREIGNGYFYAASSTYHNYYTMDLGTSGKTSYFTDTFFLDSNGNGTYDPGEGVPGVTLDLVATGTPTNFSDRSSGAGSFAVPLQTIPAGALVQVIISNGTPAQLTLSVPRNYQTLETISLSTRQSRVLGTFQLATTPRNVGLRDLAPVHPTTASPMLQATVTRSQVILRWPSVQGRQYQPEWTTDLVTWNRLFSAGREGTGGEMSTIDTPAADGQKRFYRLQIQ